MVEVQRIWRVNTSTSGPVDVGLGSDGAGDHRVVLTEGGSDRTYDLDEARAIAQAILEACEVDTALREDAAPAAVDAFS